MRGVLRICVKGGITMAFSKDRGDAPMKRRGGIRRRKKVCVFCGKENNEIDYKDEKNHRELREAPESPDDCDQESAPRRSYAVRSGLTTS